MKTIQKQQGFALLEVLIAALIMTIGGVAYMRLQQIGLQHHYNNYARTQGVTIAHDFIDTLRNNIDHFDNTIIEGKIVANNAELNPNEPFDFNKNKSCLTTMSQASNGVPTASTTCDPKKTFELQNTFIQQQLQASVPNSILCYRISQTGFVRVTYLWKDNSKASQQIDLTQLQNGRYCPEKFNTVVDAKLKHNVVSIYAQL